MIVHNPLIQRYRFSLLRPRQIGIYGFLYVALVALILLLNYTVFTTLKPFFFGQATLPFTMSQAIFYQFLFLQVIILWVWASYNSGSALTTEILRKSYVFLKLLPITALQKTFGMLFGTNLIAYAFALLNFLVLLIFAYLGPIKALLASYYFLLIIAVAGFLNTLTLLLSINPDAKKRRRLGTLVIIAMTIWGVMTVMGILFASGRARPHGFETIRVDFFGVKIPGVPFFAGMLCYFTGWILLGIVRKFQHEREPLFSHLGSAVFFLGFEGLTTGLFWSFFYLKSAFYGHCALCFWGLVLINLGALKDVGKYFEAIRKIQIRSPATFQAFLRFLRYSTLGWGICLFGLWTAFFFGLSRMAALSFSDIGYPFINLFGFYLVFMVLLEVFVLYRHLHLSMKVFLICLALLSLLLPLSLSKIFEDRLLYLHSVIGYMGNLMVPFLLRSGNAAVQWRVLGVNLLCCFLPLFLIFRKYFSFLTLRKQM